MKTNFDRFAIKGFVLKLWRDLLYLNSRFERWAYFIDKTLYSAA